MRDIATSVAVGWFVLVMVAFFIGALRQTYGEIKGGPAATRAERRRTAVGYAIVWAALLGAAWGAGELARGWT